ASVPMSPDVIAPFLKQVVGDSLESTRQHLVELADRTRSEGSLQPQAKGEIVNDKETLVDRSRAKQAALKAELEGEPAVRTLTGSETGVTSLKARKKQRGKRALVAAALCSTLALVIAGALLVTKPWKPVLAGAPLVLGFAPIIDK